MTDQLKAALDSIHAEEALKQRTREYLHNTVYQDKKRTSPLRRVRPALAAACLLLILCVSGWYVYFTPTAFISIDVNPSLELGVNRFDRIVSVEAYNQDGQALADTLEVKNLDYRTALEQILADQEVEAYLSDGILSLTVAGRNEDQCSAIYRAMEDCASGHENVRCHSSGSETVAEAHTHGMSVGKYRAYLILHQLDPDITAVQVQGMTMGELYQLIETYSREQGVDPLLSAEGSARGYGHGGQGYGHDGHGYRHGADD